MTRRVPDMTIRWSKREAALVYNGCKYTAPILAHLLEGLHMEDLYGGVLSKDDPRHGKTVAQELEARGYDMSTLRLSISKKDGVK